MQITTDSLAERLAAIHHAAHDRRTYRMYVLIYRRKGWLHKAAVAKVLADRAEQRHRELMAEGIPLMIA